MLQTSEVLVKTKVSWFKILIRFLNIKKKFKTKSSKG